MGDGGFGSTGKPQVMFTLPGTKPTKPITFQHPDGGTLTTKAALLDTGADVTIIPSFA